MENDFYQNNINALGKRYPDIAESVRISTRNSYALLPSRDENKPNLIFKHHEGNSPSLLFYDNESPLDHVKSFLGKLKLENARFIVLLGMGLGYALPELLKINNLKKIIVVEKDFQCLKLAMEASDLSGIISNPAVEFIVGCPEDKLYVNFNKTVIPYAFGLKEMKCIPWPAALSSSNGYYNSIMEILSDVTSIWMAERGNDPFDTLVGYEQFFKNIKEYLNNPGAEYIKDIYTGKPAIVVATGPSLKKNIHLLKEVENSAVILSADSSIRILHKHNILPHFVTTVERTPGFDKQFMDLDHHENTVFAAVSFVHPTTLSVWKGPFVFFNRIYSFMERLGLTVDSLDVGLSTANMAFSVARHMGCNPIILVGNDLAFDSAGNSHSEGFLYGEKKDSDLEDDRIRVPGNYEKSVVTSMDWYKCIKQYERRIAEWNGTLINATAGGAKISGSRVMDLKEVINRYCSKQFYPWDIISNHLSNWENKRDIDSVFKPVQQFVKDIEPVIDISRKMLAILTPLLEEIEQAGEILPEPLISDMKDCIPHIETAMDSVSSLDFIASFGEYFITEIVPMLMEWQVVNDRFESPEWVMAYRIKLAEEFFGIIGQLCISLRPILQDGENRLHEMLSQ